MRKYIGTIVALLFIAVIGVAFAMALSAENPIPGYDSRGKRDPMVPLIGQDKNTGVVGIAEIATIDDVKLEGIAVRTSGSRTAIINGELVKEGHKAGEVVVKKIMKNSVSLTISGKDYTVNLSEEGAKKSE